jgi:hypothetical protein
LSEMVILQGIFPAFTILCISCQPDCHLFSSFYILRSQNCMLCKYMLTFINFIIRIYLHCHSLFVIDTFFVPLLVETFLSSSLRAWVDLRRLKYQVIDFAAFFWQVRAGRKNHRGRGDVTTSFREGFHNGTLVPTD